MTSPLPFSEAFATVQRYAGQVSQRSLPTERVALLEGLGRVLAVPVVADRPQPPFARSTRDGFAARAADWARGPVTIQGLLRAGEAWQGGALAPGAAIEIMTGAPVPAGLDAVAMIEHVERHGGSVALVAGRTLGTGENIVAAGAEATEGAILVAAGTRLTTHGVAVAAACGYAEVPVYRKPRVAILATGDELVDVAEQPAAHQIRNSNTYTLAAQVRVMGGEPVLFAPVADDAEALASAIREAAMQSELLLLSGGVSMGKYDLVEPALASLGGRFFFTGARIQPGKPVVFGAIEELPFFGLPGNPVSTIVCFQLFVAPVLAGLAGEPAFMPRFAEARVRERVSGKPGLTRFLPALVRYDVHGASVEAIAWQGSGDLASTARANCFLVVPEGTALAAGDHATVLLA